MTLAEKLFADLLLGFENVTEVQRILESLKIHVEEENIIHPIIKKSACKKIIILNFSI